MLKVLIADDETRICRLIQMLVDWEILDMEVVGTAANGIEALDLTKELQPDILVTDIRMPGCDGLELIEKVRQRNSQIEIIIISGYAQFEYAQLAIQRGVGGYLLKPIKKEALIAALEKARERISMRQDSELTLEHLRTDGKKRQELSRERLIDDLVHHRISSLTAAMLLERYGFPVETGLVQAFVVKIDGGRQGLSEAAAEALRERVWEILEAEVCSLCDQRVFRFFRMTGYGLLHYAAGHRKEIRRRLRECLNQLQAQKTFFGAVEFTMGIGTATDEPERIFVSMQEAQHAICERLVEGTGRLLEPVGAPSQLESRRLLEEYSRTITQAVDTLSVDEAKRAVAELVFGVRHTPQVRGYEVYNLVVSAAHIFAVRLDPERKEVLTAGFEADCELCSRDMQLFTCLEELLKAQIGERFEQRRNEAIRPVRLAKQYIQQHYMEPITLEEVCTSIGFSVSYFSTLFKKETGEGFSKYLTRVRMEQAKMLLQDTNYPVSEICERVGYNDIKHFTGNFKKVTGLNPGQYRKLYG